MAVAVLLTVEASTTTANAWKRLFQAGENGGRSGVSIRNFSGSAANLWVSIVPAGSAAPASPPTEGQADYQIEPGQTYPLGSYADYRNDVYVCAANLGSIGYRAVEVVG